MSSQDQLATRLRDTFVSVIEPHEMLGTMTTKALTALFALHPDTLLNGYHIAADDDGWHVRKEDGAPLFSGVTASDCARWLARQQA